MFECPASIRRVVERLRFTCLDEQWRGAAAFYRFLCEQGHELRFSGASLKGVTGCYHCRDAGRLQRLRQKAEQDGSYLLDVQWKGSAERYSFRCQHEPRHQWTRRYGHALSDSRCSHCGRRAVALSRLAKDGLQRLQEHARNLGGDCLSPIYLGSGYKHRFRCAHGHVWEAVASAILNDGQWCAKCYVARSRLGIERAQASAREHGGQFLSAEYLRRNTRYSWSCAKGHVWLMSYDMVLAGSWCPQCRRRDIEELQRAAEAHGGRCLSPRYISSKAKYQWQCAKGHVWLAELYSITRGQWCAQCYAESRRLSIEDMRQAAQRHGGQCLSEVYRGVHKKYGWRCARGHAWSTTFAKIRAGHWCRVCANIAMTKPGSAAWKRYQPHVPKE